MEGPIEKKSDIWYICIFVTRELFSKPEKDFFFLMLKKWCGGLLFPVYQLTRVTPATAVKQ